MRERTATTEAAAKLPHFGIAVTEVERASHGYHNYVDEVVLTYRARRDRHDDEKQAIEYESGVLSALYETIKGHWMWFQVKPVSVTTAEDATGTTTAKYLVTYGYDSGD